MGQIKQLFITPETETTSAFEKHKFNLIWKVFLFLAFFSTALIISNLILNSQGILTNTLAFLMSISILISLKVSKKNTIAVLIVFIVGTAINQYTLFTALNVERIIDFMWMITVSVFVFYMSGFKLGISCVIINFTGVIISLFCVPKELIISALENQTLAFKIENSINIFAGILITTYFMHQILSYSLLNEKKLFNANADLLKQRNEKVVMLQEIHHRVKNNLQIISSLLRLQANQSNNIEIEVQFKEAVNRISSMALIHEKIYNTDNLSNVDVENYLETLIVEILNSYSIETKVSFKINSNVKNFHIDTLIPLSLIFNELITNSIKHAFIGLKTGEINILIDRKNLDLVSYSDNGTGINDNNFENFGSILIETFTEQLEGTCKIESINGVNYLFTFPKLK